MSSRRVQRWVVGLCLGLGLLVAWDAQAADTVVILRSPGVGTPWRAAEERTCDELRLMGIRVDEVRASTKNISRILAEHGARAVIRSERASDGGTVEIWLADSQAEPQRVVFDGRSLEGGEAATLAALRTAELVHARIAGATAMSVSPLVADVGPGLPVFDVPAASVPLVRPPMVPTFEAPSPVSPVAPRRVLADEEVLSAGPPPPRPVPATAGRLRSVTVSAAGLGGPGGVRGMAELALAVGLRLTTRLSLAPAVSTAVTPLAATTQAGSIRIGWIAGQVLLGYAPGRLAARISPRIGLGGGLAVAWAQGRANSPLQGSTDITPVGVLSGAAALAIRVRTRLRLHVGVGLSVLVPAVAVRASGEEVARLGPLLIRGAVGLEWEWPRAGR